MDNLYNNRVIKSITVGVLICIPVVLLCPLKAHSQNNNITGTVMDARSGETLPGVNVILKGTTIGISTNAKGHYSLGVPSLQDTLVFSFVGYQTREVSINGRNEINVSLGPQAISGEEMVVVGYGEQKKGSLTGSISSISSTELEQANPVRIEDALQGNMSGVFVQNVNSGDPGSGIKVRIRGAGSINAGNNPLYVIDDIPIEGGLEMINPNNIKSINVLKDASATAIYGSRGSNGVVLITTKKGSRGKTKIEYNGRYGIQQVAHYIDMANGEEFAKYINTMRKNDNDKPLFSDPSQYGNGTDWQHTVFKDAFSQNHEVAVSGGGEKTQFYISANYVRQGGVIPKSEFERGTLRLNLNSTLNSNLKVGTQLQLSRAYKNIATVGAASILNFPPVLGVRNSTGAYTNPSEVLPYANPDSHNPLADALEPTNNKKTNNVIGSIHGTYDLLKNLTLKSTIGVSYFQPRSESYVPSTLPSTRYQPNKEAGITNMSSIDWTNNNTITYKNTFGSNHFLKLLGGFTIEKATSTNLTVTARNFPTDYYKFDNLSAASLLETPSSNREGYSLLSYIGRANYIYNQKYLFTFTGRLDGSSRFGRDNKYGFFPSGAIGWRVSNEDFMQHINFLSNLKIRASYGITGNQNIESYSSLAKLSPSEYAIGEQRTIGIGPRSVANPNLQWEKSIQLDIGANIGFLSNHVNFDFDYYHKKSSDLLVFVNLPSSSGFETSLQNIGSVLNKGIEASFNVRETFGDFSWTANGNITTLHNKVESISTSTNQIISSTPQQIFGGNNITKRGYPMGMFYTYVYEGRWQSQEEIDKVGTMKSARPGEDRYKDVNNDGVFNNKDRVIVGNPQPDFYYGFKSTFGYSDFTLSIFLQGVYGNKIINMNRTNYGSPNGDGNITKAALDFWSPTNRNASHQIASRHIIGRYSTKWIQDGSYLRFKDITLKYNFTSNLLSKTGIKKLVISGSLQNAFTITGYKGLNPEESNYDKDNTLLQGWNQSNYPSVRSIVFGINISF